MRIQEFSSGGSGGGGDPGPSAIKSLDNIFLVLNLFYCSPLDYFRENYKNYVPEGVLHFEGAGNFFEKGVQWGLWG